MTQMRCASPNHSFEVVLGLLEAFASSTQFHLKALLSTTVDESLAGAVILCAFLCRQRFF